MLCTKYLFEDFFFLRELLLSFGTSLGMLFDYTDQN